MKYIKPDSYYTGRFILFVTKHVDIHIYETYFTLCEEEYLTKLFNLYKSWLPTNLRAKFHNLKDLFFDLGRYNYDDEYHTFFKELRSWCGEIDIAERENIYHDYFSLIKHKLPKYIDDTFLYDYMLNDIIFSNNNKDIEFIYGTTYITDLSIKPIKSDFLHCFSVIYKDVIKHNIPKEPIFCFNLPQMWVSQEIYEEDNGYLEYNILLEIIEIQLVSKKISVIKYN